MCAILALGLVVSSGRAGAQAPGETLGSPHRGGTLRLTADSSGGTLDPQINYTSTYLQLFSVLYDGLLTFPKVEGMAGTRVVADLADHVPEPEDGGRTWRFTLRQGVRFSDGRPVTTDDVVASFRRLFKVGAPTAGAFYGAIVGADACLAHPASCTLEGGIEADPDSRQVIFHLSRPDGEFLQKIAFPHAVILPADTPAHDVGNQPVPTTGPYRIVSYDPNRALTLDRNPAFRMWSAEAQPDGYVDHILYSFGLDDEAETTAVENGHYDWMYEDKPQDRLGELGARYASQLHIQPLFAFWYLPMNTRRAPFDNVLARRAVNYAIDRRALTMLYGGPALATPLCSMVPPVFPGGDIACPYTRDPTPDGRWHGPDLERARALVRQSGTAGQHVTLIVANRSIDIGMGTYVRNTLESIGYHVDMKPLNIAIQFPYIQNTNNHVQIALTDWFADYASPSNFLDDLLGCENFHPGSDSSINMAGYCNQTAQDLMIRALATTDTVAQADLWRQAARIVMDDAPTAPIMSMRYLDFVSARVGNYVYTMLYHLCFSRVWVQ
ncbi:peptide ABC transporter substrate-binding protein [Ameyamaea chiangmaiensis NBRC 103196]|uniref:ABC transporter substrate-binding protein n=2 Tax=Ameyamaea chiangmaiensis TaxID=442969 RepID=A0A850PDY2_9PROT|nr:ABC transporter substrate-binding protein [Ameyamaea chiangmaiensis]MBS4074120.1 ABC transporter substrate-binding protein [Ameyamaea chiangmaiensis]NVN40899.1 ABC transporter substrate-binding protein [Ameyamaea chiangmaiensis]GBQ70952.1 peptide ABC transporter substrate-binding protein [Ameyamaea chiangmaiensis NBRC 103196]